MPMKKKCFYLAEAFLASVEGWHAFLFCIIEKSKCLSRARFDGEVIRARARETNKTSDNHNIQRSKEVK
jgi:hypothetical protein